MGRLVGKVALISGGARGQGTAETQLFVREGAAVVFGDILDDEGKKVEAEIRATGGQATYVHLNVTREADWRAAVTTAVQTYGKLDVLVNNAGILFRAKIEDTTEADWDRIMAVNVKGVFLGTKCAIPAMRQAGGGSIINISSTAGLVGSPGETAARHQGRRPTLHQVHGHPAREGQDPLQLRTPGADRDRHDQGRAGESSVLGAAAAPPADGARRNSGGGCLRRAVPGVGRSLVRDGERAGDRRRHDRRIDRRGGLFPWR